MESKPQIPALRSVSGDEHGSTRIGPFQVVRHLVSGPGAQLMEATGEDGAQVLLQIVRCRASRSSADEADRKQMLEAIRSATEELEGALTILQHGHADADGESIIYWALPWDERAVELGAARIDDDDELVSVGIHLAKRLTVLHANHRLDPLLSERLVVIENGEPWVAGAPMRVPDRWLSPGMRAARLAPEETLAKEPTMAGDVWRLGQALKALTVYLDRLPTRVWRALELLGHPDVGVRVRTADKALSILESLADPHAPDPPSISDITRAQAPAEPTQPEARIPTDENAITIADEPLAFGTRKLVDDLDTEPPQAPVRPSRLPITEGDTLLDVKRPRRSPVEPIVVLEPGGIEDPGFLEAPTVGAPPASKVKPTEAAEPIEAAIPQMRKKKRGSWDTNPKQDDNAGPTGTVLGPKPPSSLLKRSTTLPGVKRIEPAALPRMLPPPKGMLAGPKGTLVGGSPFDPRQIMRVPRVTDPSHEPTVDERPTPPEQEAQLDEALPPEVDDEAQVDTVPSPRSAAIGVLTFIVGVLIGAVASKGLRMLEDDPNLLAAAAVIPGSNVVRLDAEPPGSAIVVAEEDGRILGSTPLWFQIAPEQQVSVLVAAPGHEPMRATLPDRGHLRVMLEPRTRERENCLVNLHLPQNVPVESVASTIQETPSGFHVPGSAVIRAVGELRGAWLLRCPNLSGEGVLTLPGRQLEKEVELRVSSPADMEVSIDGEVAGTSPMRKRVPSGFKLIRIASAKGDSLERWVPVFGDAEVEFPDPN